MNKDFWRGKRVFVTGHTGFKGSWLSLWLQQTGAQVTGYALEPPTNPSLFELASVGQGMQSRIADIRDPDALSGAMNQSRPEIVFHMAAQALVRHSYANPVETYATNVMGTVHLLEAVRRTSSVKAVINITSDKCYKNQEWVWSYRENDSLGGHDPYSSSKACSELVTDAYRNSYFNPIDQDKYVAAVASARAGNVIGGGDWAMDRLIPDILRAIEKGEPVCIRSSQAIRPWQHVLEPLSGYLRLAEKLYNEGSTYAEEWNFGPSEEDAKSVQWIVDYMVRSWGEGTSWSMDKANHPHEANTLKLNTSKARAKLQWASRWDVQTALESIVSWHKAYLLGGNMKDITLRQIAQYESSVNCSMN
ncbi:MAG: CDP-glucose 4,6-dehydratase [Betaproteobacteria bacterium]|nr:CDP-glucose 4,6-dehydratase [Betaproteobacteria bacterium]